MRHIHPHLGHRFRWTSWHCYSILLYARSPHASVLLSLEVIGTLRPVDETDKHGSFADNSILPWANSKSIKSELIFI